MEIRPMTRRDLPALRNLLHQLGYTLEPDTIAARYATVTAAPDHALMVAIVAAAPVGLVHVYFRPALEKAPQAIVQALVTDQAHRGRGVGGALMTAAEDWARRRGLPSVALSSQVHREVAHKFYAARGYAQVATSLTLQKDLS